MTHSILILMGVQFPFDGLLGLLFFDTEFTKNILDFVDFNRKNINAINVSMILMKILFQVATHGAFQCVSSPLFIIGEYIHVSSIDMLCIVLNK